MSIFNLKKLKIKNEYSVVRCYEVYIDQFIEQLECDLSHTICQCALTRYWNTCTQVYNIPRLLNDASKSFFKERMLLLEKNKDMPIDFVLDVSKIEDNVFPLTCEYCGAITFINLNVYKLKRR